MFLKIYLLFTFVVTENCVKNSLVVRRMTSLNMSRKHADCWSYYSECKSTVVTFVYCLDIGTTFMHCDQVCSSSRLLKNTVESLNSRCLTVATHNYFITLTITSNKVLFEWVANCCHQILLCSKYLDAELDMFFCTDSSNAKSVAELCTGFVCCTWNIYGRRASCVATAGHAMAWSGQRTNLLRNVSVHIVSSIQYNSYVF